MVLRFLEPRFMVVLLYFCLLYCHLAAVGGNFLWLKVPPSLQGAKRNRSCSRVGLCSPPLKLTYISFYDLLNQRQLRGCIEEALLIMHT